MKKLLTGLALSVSFLQVGANNPFAALSSIAENVHKATKALNPQKVEETFKKQADEILDNSFAQLNGPAEKEPKNKRGQEEAASETYATPAQQPAPKEEMAPKDQSQAEEVRNNYLRAQQVLLEVLRDKAKDAGEDIEANHEALKKVVYTVMLQSDYLSRLLEAPEKAATVKMKPAEKDFIIATINDILGLHFNRNNVDALVEDFNTKLISEINSLKRATLYIEIIKLLRNINYVKQRDIEDLQQAADIKTYVDDQGLENVSEEDLQKAESMFAEAKQLPAMETEPSIIEEQPTGASPSEQESAANEVDKTAQAQDNEYIEEETYYYEDDGEWGDDEY